MHARQLIDEASFGPEALAVIRQAFDAAWEEVSRNFDADPDDTYAARLRLATALLAIASEDSRDVDVLKRGALRRFALDYRR